MCTHIALQNESTALKMELSELRGEITKLRCIGLAPYTDGLPTSHSFRTLVLSSLIHLFIRLRHLQIALCVSDVELSQLSSSSVLEYTHRVWCCRGFQSATETAVRICV